MTQLSYSLDALLKDLPVTIQGDATCLITGVSSIQHAKPGHITFLTNAHYRQYLATTGASAVIVGEEERENVGACASIVTAHPYYVYAKVAAHFCQVSPPVPGIHSTAIVGKETVIDKTASIGPYCVIGSGVTIGPRVVLGAYCSIGDHAELAEDVRLDAQVTLYDRVIVGPRTKIASGVVIGGEGFGFAPYQGVWHPVPQLGHVVIGADVSIGANTAIDRGAIEPTIIEEGVKLDNLIQVAHNVTIGAHTVIAGCVAIAGSVHIGKHCMIGGASCLAGHIRLCDQTVVTGMTAVTKSITEPGIYSSGIVGAVPNLTFRKNNARFHRLENLMERVKSLESMVRRWMEKQEK